MTMDMDTVGGLLEILRSLPPDRRVYVQVGDSKECLVEGRTTTWMGASIRRCCWWGIPILDDDERGICISSCAKAAKRRGFEL
jgi:hypothetical protein